MKILNFKKINRGFTVVEVVIAIGLVALLLTGVLGLMAPATNNIDKALSKGEATRALDTAIAEMNNFKDSDDGVTDYNSDKTGFGKALKWIQDSNTKNGAVLIYNYSGELGVSEANLLSDGSLPGIQRSSSSPGEYVVRPKAMRYKDITGDYQDTLSKGVVSGRVYLVKFRGYSKDATSGGLELNDDYHTAGGDNLIEESSLGMVVVQAEVYALKSNLWDEYISKSAFNISKLGRPLHTRVVAFNR